MYITLFFQTVAVLTGLVAMVWFLRVVWPLRKKIDRHIWKRACQSLCVLVLAFGLYLLSGTSYPLHFAMPPTTQAMTMDHRPASLPIFSLLNFLLSQDDFARVADIGRNPNDVPQATNRQSSTVVQIAVRAQEVLSEVAPGIWFNFWTYDGTVPGPMYRVRVGDTVQLSLTNDATSLHSHNIDLHAVTGPGGGASLTNVKPGETKSFQWLAMNPGLYVYHCATSNVSTHNSHGQYGLILVEPEEGLAPVDKEFYVMQGELYTLGGIGKKGLTAFDTQGLLGGNPTYITFNGKIEQTPRMHVKVGDRVRMYVGNGGVNLISSFHMIGEIFDVVYPEAAMGEGSAVFKNVQTTAVLPGGAAIVEFTADVPGTYLLVDHALARMNKGAWAQVVVEGDPQPAVFSKL